MNEIPVRFFNLQRVELRESRGIIDQTFEASEVRMARCDSGARFLVFFHVKDDYLERILPVGATRVVSGRVEHFNNQVQISGIDAPLLKQRTDFLRPDSLLAIVLLSDETDVSIKEYSAMASTSPWWM